MELCIGTVQFGMDYGIHGQKRPPMRDSIECLEYATSHGIRAIDTAKSYGNAERIVGEFLKLGTINRTDLIISTKLKPNVLDSVNPSDYESVIEEELISQLKDLNTDYVDVFLYHSARYAFDREKIEAIHGMKSRGLARKVGVSIYEPEEAKACFANKDVEYIQMPYSVFDHRMRENNIFSLGRDANCEMAVRSAFIQGLITMKEDQIPPFLYKAKPILEEIDTFCNDCGISRVHLALQYVKKMADASYIVIGVDSLDQLKEDVELFEDDLPDEILEVAGKRFDGLEADIVMPSLWKK